MDRIIALVQEYLALWRWQAAWGCGGGEWSWEALEIADLKGRRLSAECSKGLTKRQFQKNQGSGPRKRLDHGPGRDGIRKPRLTKSRTFILASKDIAALLPCLGNRCIWFCF